MCYTVEQLEKRAVKTAKRMGAVPKGNLQLDLFVVSGFEHPKLLTITNEEPKILQPIKWGLVPHWVKDEEMAVEISNKTLNARSETIFEKPSFKTACNNRCLIPVEGFFEWREFKKKKYPYFVHLKDNETFFLGGIFDSWVDKSSGEIVKGFSILTTAANPLMEMIHNIKKRMPFIVPFDLAARWITPELSKEEMMSLIKPFDDRFMEAHTVNNKIINNKYDRNRPEVTAAFVYPELDAKNDITLFD